LTTPRLISPGTASTDTWLPDDVTGMGVRRIKERLDAATGFWPALHGALDALGFDGGYVERLTAPPHGGRRKYVKDSVWGMMDFEPHELAIIDSPLLQRLRRISQLGLTFLTYPSAEHSRFSHTLGVTHVLKRLVASISDAARREPILRAGNDEYQLYDPSADGAVARSLAHAALLHDVGHLAFSHAGETAFSAGAGLLVGGMELEDFIACFREEGFESGLSECLSIAVCLSPRFRAFYGRVLGADDVDGRLREICCFIGGVPHDPRYPGLANLISGAAVDADKIDYLNRDARQCGIPVGVDVSRVFLNSALVRISQDQALALSRSRIGQTGGGRFSAGVHFIVNSSGIDTYDELANAKAVLYQRVYLHQLTRNAEQVLSEAVHGAIRDAPATAGPDPRDIFTWFGYGDDELLARLSRERGSRQIAARLVTRDLPKRAFVIYRDACEPFVSLRDVFDAGEWDVHDARGALADLELVYRRATCWRLFDQLVPVDPVERPRRLAELRDLIRREAIAVRRSVDPGFVPPAPNAAEPYVGLSPRFELKPINEVLVREKNSIGHSGQWTKSEELSNADNLGRGVDHVHADREWLPYVAVACTKVLYDLHAGTMASSIPDGAATGDGSAREGFPVRPRLLLRLEEVCSRTGVDHGRLLDDMATAARAGYFGAAERIVPLDGGLLPRCGTVAARYATFRGEGGWQVSPGSVAAFVRQFPVGLRPEMLSLLAEGTIITRGAVGQAFDRMTAASRARGEGGIVFARFSPNSGNVTGIALEQERRDTYLGAGHGFVRNLAELEVRLAGGPADCVAFVDDQFASGGQASAQILHWAGVPRERWPAAIQGERNIDMSAPGDRTLELLRSGRVRLMFVHGTESGRTRVVETARSAGFADLDVVFDRLIPASPILSGPLREFLAEVGRGLLRAIRHGDAPVDAAADAALAADAVGYGGIGSVMVTPTSAPSHAITALWCPGAYAGQPWLPLFLRRGYRKHLVFG
jgi:HD superfamily phosphohydrolase